MPKKPKDVVTIDNESDEEVDDQVDMDEGDEAEEDDVEVEGEEDEEEYEEEESEGEEEEEGQEAPAAFGDLANPSKKLPNSSKTPEAGGPQSQKSPSPVYQRPFQPPVTDPNVPSQGYTSIDEEKADLLFKMDRLRKKGMTVRIMDFTNDIREIRLEAARIRNEMELDNSLAFSKKMLMAVVSTMEFLNKRYDPFDLALDGWGEHVMEGIDSYDNVLEKLYYKYRNRASMPPEMELLLSLAGSAFMFHMTNSMFKKLASNAGGGGGNNPDLLRSMMSAFSNVAKQASPSQAAAPQQSQPPPPPQQQQQPSYEMRAPTIDLGPFMNMMGGGGLFPPQPPPPPMATRPQQQPRAESRVVVEVPPPPAVTTNRNTNNIESFLPEPSPIVKSTTIQVAPIRNKKVLQKEYDDRLSDIISEDLESVSSDISNMSSPAPSTSGSVKNLFIPDSSSKKRGRPRKNASLPFGKVLQL